MACREVRGGERGGGGVAKQMPKQPELLTSAVSYLTQLGRGVVSIFHGNSRIHDCTFQRRELLLFQVSELASCSAGWVSTAWSLLAHFSLDSHVHPGRRGSPHEGRGHAEKARGRLALR